MSDNARNGMKVAGTASPWIAHKIKPAGSRWPKLHNATVEAAGWLLECATRSLTVGPYGSIIAEVITARE